ncbi:hypothetical protein [Streptomyces sp. LS1784]|uniref:hypothetical protein n=1 Tax=Streptomyces sp. LS1784 TaxID=2851533 RepID=UPI001CD02F68|nr:hypothetical protein [Streptomyces sp. LS1784]
MDEGEEGAVAQNTDGRDLGALGVQGEGLLLGGSGDRRQGGSGRCEGDHGQQLFLTVVIPGTSATSEPRTALKCSIAMV